ncbi:MAG TPA: hypothetical protein VN961_21225 [Streptosporangiaceae bacterium]|nr:hypothetical protein [Streptosporangiaceae bacterium]
MDVSAHCDTPGRFKIPYTTAVDVNSSGPERELTADEGWPAG